MTIKIGTLNARGGDSKTPQLIKLFNEANIDVCMVQEVHNIKNENIQRIEKDTKTKIYVSPGDQNSRGVMTMIKVSNVIKNPVVVRKDAIGNYLVVQIEIDGRSYELVNLYAPMTPAGRAELFKKLNKETHGKEYQIIAGDFNNVMDFNLDCTGGSRKNFDQRKSDRSELLRFTKENDYTDSLRVIHPKLCLFTFCGLSNYKSRLDRIYVHTNLSKKLDDAKVVPACFSDHDLYVISLLLDNQTDRVVWGKGLWKHNKQILENKENRDKIRRIWNEHQEAKYRHRDICQWWENAKKTVKTACIEMGKMSRQTQNTQKKDLINELGQLTSSTDPASSRRILEIKAKLNEIEQEDINGAIIRSRVQWQNEGEKSTKYFYNLERKQGTERQITELRDEIGNIYKEKSDILKYVKTFYENKFSYTDLENEACDALLDSVTRRLTDEQRDEQAGPFTMSELERVKAKMSRSKAPGNDGLTVEFYDQCWNFIKHDLLEVINEIAATGRIPLSMTQAAITLIYKNKGERSSLNNWRAISLCNVDYKFLTGMIAARMDPYLSQLIHEDQSCGIRNRHIEDPLIYMHSMIDYVRQFGGKSLIYGLDLQAAFDMVHHEYMHRLLARMNIGFRMRDLLKTIYDNMYSSVIVNGAKTPYFRLRKSIRQGDKASMCCFIMAMEPLANIIRRDSSIHPILLPNSKPKCTSLYCDDMNVLSSDINDIPIIQTHMAAFERGSGSKFNQKKTEVLLVGNWTQFEESKISKEHLRKNIKFLGVWFGDDAKKLNQEMITTKIDDALEFWKTIPLSFSGKRLIITSKVLPQLYHVIRITGMDRDLKNAVQKRINEFVWNPKKMYMIAYSTLQNTIEYGGLGMPNLEVINQAILAERIPKMLKSPRIWNGQFMHRLGYILGNITKKLMPYQYAITRRKTTVTATIEEAYKKLNAKVSDWKSENFQTLKQKLHKNNDYKKVDENRDYRHTWKTIESSTDDRRRRDISYLAAHGALTVGAVLKRRNVTTDDTCKLCGEKIETIKHLFIECSHIQTTKETLRKKIGRTLTEELILYHEGYKGMKKKERNAIAAFKQTIWQVRAKLYSGDIKGTMQIKTTMDHIFKSKIDK